MGTFKYLLKVIGFFSLTLAIGQIRAGSGTVGSQFLTGVENGTRWTGQQILEAKWMAGVNVPEFLIKWIQSSNTPKPERHAEIDRESHETISGVDRRAILRLLKEQN